MSTATRATSAARLPNARRAGTFRIGGTISVNRLGFGAMRVTGPGVWGEPEDRDEALRTLMRLPALGVNFVDTANSYGPEVSERLIREALHPYVGILVATKAGLTRPGPGQWVPFGQPDYLMQPRRARAGTCSASRRSACGSCTASTPTCRATSSSTPSARCSTRASSSTPA